MTVSSIPAGRKAGRLSGWGPSGSRYPYRISFLDGTILNMVSSKTQQLIDQALVGYGGGEAPTTRMPEPPTQARGFEKRDRIYEAAIARFEDQGVAATKVDDVIADADVSWATFFRYFPRKGDVLIEAAARHFRDHVRPSVEDSLADRRLKMSTVIRRLLVSLLQPADLPPALHGAALLEIFASPDRFAALVGDGPSPPATVLLEEVLAEGQKRGEIRRDLDPAVAALTVIAGSALIGAQAVAVGIDPSEPVAASFEISWRGIAAD
jgi:TetR/AcrR family transcriptional regulator, repressor for uid operon